MNYKNNRKILFLTANAGTGHTRAAEALKSCMEEQASSYCCEVVNSYQYLNRIMGKLVEEGYINMIKIIPKVYGFLYDRKNKKNSIHNLKDWLNRSAAGNFKKMLDEKRPDLVVCTHAFPCGVMSEVKKQFNIPLKTVGVITDYVVSPFWIYPETDLYLIATEELRGGFANKGFPPDKVKVTGIPVDPRFYNEEGKGELRKRLQLDEKLPVILVMGGGLGLKPVSGIIPTLKKLTIPCQAVLIFGKNDDMREKMDEEVAKLKDLKVRVKTLGYIENIHEYMKGADLLVTKPGGMTIAEALCAGLPMVLTNPIPGQETKNVRFLRNKGLVERDYGEKELPDIIEKFLSNGDYCSGISKRARSIARGDSSRSACREIFNLLQ